MAHRDTVVQELIRSLVQEGERKDGLLREPVLRETH